MYIYCLDNVVTKNLYSKIAKLPFLLLNLLKALNQVREFQKFSNEFREVTARYSFLNDEYKSILIFQRRS